MSISGLEKIRELYSNENTKFKRINRNSLMDYFMKTIIETFKEQSNAIADIKKRVKKLEQAKTYYPMQSEIKDIKVGGTD